MHRTSSFTTTGSAWLRPISAMALACAMLVSAAAPALAVGGSTFVSIANQYRAGAGVAPLALHAAVDKIAVERADRNAAANSSEHDMDYVKQRLQQMGVCWSRVGEIIAWESGYSTHSYERTMQQWWKSSGHHDIIVGDYNAAGGSWKVGRNGRTYSVMVFIKGCASTAVAAPTLGKARFASGTHTGYRFSGTAIVGTKTGSLDRASGATVASRSRINGHVYLKMANGHWAGYWLRESTRVYLPGIVGKVTYRTPVKLVFNAGTYTGYKYSSTGVVLDRRAATLWRGSSAEASATAVINGRPHFLVRNGIWAGYWVPDTAGVWRPG